VQRFEARDPGLGPRRPRRLLLIFSVGLVPFVLLATMNSAGYRYGASDLAFYGPAVMRQLDPSLFPRDTPVIDAQARLTFMDETVAAVSRLTTEHLPTLFLGLYVLTLALLAFGLGAIGESLYRNRWTTVALLAAMTLRHAIAKSGTNSLEGYFHPRQLAFAFGVLAIAAFLRGWTIVAALALCAAGSLHPTTTLWLAIWLGAAVFISRPQLRRWLGAAIAVLTVVGLWTLTLGPLAGRLTLMDREWLTALAGKDYLFPLQWPAAAWLTNLGYIVLIVWLYSRRVAAGVTTAPETGLAVGSLALAATFAVAVPLNAARVGLAIQLQPARVFWMLDLMATIYVVWAIAEGRASPEGGAAEAKDASPLVRQSASALLSRTRRTRITAAVLLVLSIVRGVYIMQVQFPGRRIFAPDLAGDWGQVAAWARSTPKDSEWLADPMHAALYGTSLRMAAARDVFVEGTKDAAIGMYDRSIALRTRDRLTRLANFGNMSAEDFRDVGREYQLEYLVSEAELPLPLAFQSGKIRVYRLR
jgi:hypothetical protein